MSDRPDDRDALRPAAQLIPLFSNSLGAEELRAVAAVFDSHWVGEGEHCAALERELAAELGADHVLLLNNCTAGLYLVCRALGLGPGDEVIVATVNFVACASAVIDCGAVPVFADVDPRTLNLLPAEVQRLRTPRTRAVIVLHYGGHPAAVDDIRAACGDGVYLIEDAANALASTYRGRRCGTLGAAGCFSFDAMKILVMGDGGAVVVRDAAVRERLEALRYLGLAPGRSSGSAAMAAAAERWWEYDLVATSGRFISNDILAAIGREQLRKLPAFIERRRQVWQRYQQALDDLPGVRTPPEPLPECTSSYYLYWIQVDSGRDALAAALRDAGVYTTFRYYPLHRVGHFGSTQRLPNAERAAATTLNLPLHHNLDDRAVDRICDAVTSWTRTRS